MRAARPRGFGREAARFWLWVVELAGFFLFGRELMCSSPLLVRFAGGCWFLRGSLLRLLLLRGSLLRILRGSLGSLSVCCLVSL